MLLRPDGGVGGCSVRCEMKIELKCSLYDILVESGIELEFMVEMK